MNLLVMFALGLAGSLHCVQMCGPLVLSFGLTMSNSTRTQQTIAHAAYHLGRVLTYSVLGAVAGWLGCGMSLVGSIAGIQNTAAIISGVFMMVAGLLLWGALKGNGLIQIGQASRLTAMAGRLLRLTTARGRFFTGLLMGLLPCGMIYAALLRSVASATPLAGALDMAAFGAGTAGPLLGLGVFSVTINRLFATNRWGLKGPNWAAAGVMLMGAALIWRGLVTPAQHFHHMH